LLKSGRDHRKERELNHKESKMQLVNQVYIADKKASLDYLPV